MLNKYEAYFLILNNKVLDLFVNTRPYSCKNLAVSIKLRKGKRQVVLLEKNFIEFSAKNVDDVTLKWIERRPYRMHKKEVGYWYFRIDYKDMSESGFIWLVERLYNNLCKRVRI